MQHQLTTYNGYTAILLVHVLYYPLLAGVALFWETLLGNVDVSSTVFNKFNHQSTYNCTQHSPQNKTAPIGQ